MEHPRSARRLFVLGRDAMPRADTPGVEAQPAYEWLLLAPDEDSIKVRATPVAAVA